ncbi:P-loop NTPase [Candidatus Berkiella cookevillensis]|uniref:Flagellum site-determining protein YlxH n=1 Tax=Candidatus Berkiella cookevillensis TaxID=437022 RepID=A0A0Q9YGY6_9GAMM|nr:P-loop NTPase [Candidatus Berkiella cookevillensis]MCS5708594.1 P-loop NTPase [Candidatus Berkiella cookevillensis]
MNPNYKPLPHKKQVIAITGGKGGIGKTNTAINLSIAQSMLGERVFLLDADFGLSNIDVALGLKPTLTLNDVIDGKCELNDIILKGPLGVNIIPAASGVQRLVQLQPLEYMGLIDGFNSLSDQVDTFIIDTAAGISDMVVRFSLAANEIIVVLSDEPTSLTDAYSLIKILNTKYQIKRMKILVNMSSSLTESKEIFAKLTNVADKYLSVSLHFLGWIPNDEYVKRAIKQQKSLMELYPSSKAAQHYREIAAKLIDMKKSLNTDTNSAQLFLEDMIKPLNFIEVNT